MTPRRWFAAFVIVTLLGIQPTSMAGEQDPEGLGSADRDQMLDRTSWTLEERQAYGAQIAPEAPRLDVVTSREVEPVPAAVPSAAGTVEPADPVWLEAMQMVLEPDSSPHEVSMSIEAVRARIVTDPPDEPGGDALADAGETTGASARARTGLDPVEDGLGVLEVLDHDTTLAIGADAAAVRLHLPDQLDGELVEIEFDYGGFAGAHGGDWTSRLQVVALPGCVLTSPGIPECSAPTSLESTNDLAAQQVSARVPAVDGTVLALTAGASGPAGSWAATSLSPSATWQVSHHTGDFSWSYPLRTPVGPGGPEPQLALAYSSGSVDGKVVTTNTQTSWIGEGWDLTTGYIERRYVPCDQDSVGGNNASLNVGDLCWGGDNAFLVLGGRADELIQDSATGRWRARTDDGTRIERLTGAPNGDNDGEYWKVTTTDGTAYYFGRGQRSAGDTAALNSTWTVPVYGNHAGDPCHQASFNASACDQAWRWNLEYVVDPSGNTMTYFYTKETNTYRSTDGSLRTYDRGGHLTRIDYGQRAGSETTPAPMRVVFTTGERCTALDDSCGDTVLGEGDYHDVPTDLLCPAGGPCAVPSPTFFTSKRLATVTTQVRQGGGYQDVDHWTLGHALPDPGDGTSPSLWLDSITHSGRVGTAIDLPAVTFVGTGLANRVDEIGDDGLAMVRFRIHTITSESGGVTMVKYRDAQCSPTNLPAGPEVNTMACFPVRWRPEGFQDDIQEYFHKYLVESVAVDPRDGQRPDGQQPSDAAPPVETHYSYVGGAAWHYDDNPLIPAGHRTWGQFRGYAAVEEYVGAPGAQTHTRYEFFRGMHGDQLPGGGARTVMVDGVADQDRLAGFLRRMTTYDGRGGPMIETVTHAPWVSPPTATAGSGRTATLLGAQVSTTLTATPDRPAGATRTNVVTSTFDPATGLVTQVEDAGDSAVTGDEVCTRIEYVQNPTAHILGTVRRTQTVATGCSQSFTPAQILSEVHTHYDGGGDGAAPTRGLPTTIREATGTNASGAVLATRATMTYDVHGRVVSESDALGRTWATAYTPATGGPVTKVVTTSPDPDGTGPLTAHVTTTEVDPAWGAPVRITDPNGKVTTGTYDALGRLTQVWLPGRAQGAQTPNVTYAYAITGNGVNALTTQRLNAAGDYLTSVELFDGLLRPRQSQVPSADRNQPGRIITDTIYNAQGGVALEKDPWPTTGSPSTNLVDPTGTVPGATEFAYDGAGRVTRETFHLHGHPQWSTTTEYRGDRVLVDPPTGATATTAITDVRGQVVELRQHLGGAPLGTYQAITYAYDLAGRMTTAVDAAGNTWTYTFDLLGRLVEQDDPDQGRTTTVYDLADQVTSVTDARGRQVHYQYDHLGRATHLRRGSTTLASWAFDTLAKGQLSSSIRYQGSAAYVTAVTGYDDGYRPLGEAVTIPAAEGALAGTYTTSYTYTVDGQLKTITHPAVAGMGAETVAYGYDSQSMPRTMTGGRGWGVYVAETVHDSYGRLIQQDLGAVHASFPTYYYQDGTGRLERATLLRAGSPGANLDLDVAYAYDQAGNPTSIIDRSHGQAVDAQCFSFDGLRRLERAFTPANANCASPPARAGLGGPAPYWIQYAYDAAGNRVSEVSYEATLTRTKTSTHGGGASGPHAVTRVQAVAVPLGGGTPTTAASTFAYDAAGNMVTRTIAGQNPQTLTWDEEGRLTQVTKTGASTSSYRYTADGQRLVRREGTTSTLYLPGGTEVQASGQVVSATRFYSFAGRTIATRTGIFASQAHIIVSDPQGTALLMVKVSDNAVTRQRTSPFGEVRTGAPAWPTNHGFLDKPIDATGLLAVGARYYDAHRGRFISVDPIMDLADPGQWNPYAYAGNNPITYTDPTGLTRMLGDWGAPYPTSLWSITKNVASAAWQWSTGAAWGAGEVLVGTNVFVQAHHTVQFASATWGMSPAERVGAAWHGALDSFKGYLPPTTGEINDLGRWYGRTGTTIGIGVLGGAAAGAARTTAPPTTALRNPPPRPVNTIHPTTPTPTNPHAHLATNTAGGAGGVRFVANSAGEVVPYVRGGTLEVTEHAALALSRRNIGVHALDDLVTNSQGFPYWHDGIWKTGYYDPATHLFAGTVGGRVTTVMQGSRVNANYINNLQAARP